MGSPPEELGPLTAAMAATTGDGPPALNREWYGRLEHPGQFVFLCSAALKLEDCYKGWWIMQMHVGDEKPAEPIPLSVAASRVERLLSPLAHEGRVRILQALWRGPLSASELAEATGYRGGALYHHLRELDYAAYLASESGTYRLTDWGRQLLLTAACLAQQLVVDDGERGLTMPGDWEEGK